MVTIQKDPEIDRFQELKLQWKTVSIFSVGLVHAFSQTMLVTGVDTFDFHGRMRHTITIEHGTAVIRKVHEQLVALEPSHEAIARIFRRRPFGLSRVTILVSQESEKKLINLDFIEPNETKVDNLQGIVQPS